MKSTDPHSLILTGKHALYDKKSRWFKCTFPEYLMSISNQKYKRGLADGTVGIWVKPYLNDREGNTYTWVILDVEDPEAHHTSVEANIFAAKKLYMHLDKHGLTDNLNVVLSGKGLRFCWPYWIAPERFRAFLLWIEDLPAVDSAPFKNKSHYRLFAYRGHQNQGKPIDAHVHMLEHHSDLLELNESGYRRMVSGRPDPDQCIEWLKLIMPREEAPWPWWDLLNVYEAKARLRGTIVDIRFPYANTGVNWDCIKDYLDATSESREFKSGDEIILKLKVCPICGRSDGRPYVTASGRLKCFHANSCEAAKDRGGLHPSKWVPDYQGVDSDEDYQEDSGLQVKDARELILEGLNTLGDVIIDVMPGVGKTHNALQALASWMDS